MSEENESENPSNAFGNATQTQPIHEWQITTFEELLNMGELDRYLPVEIQHILALNAAFRSAMPAFYQAYANAFQDIHTKSMARDSDAQTMAYNQEIYFSMPTPLEEMMHLVTTKAQMMQNSNRMTGFNFETNSGPISWVPSPNHISPVDNEQWKLAIRTAKEERLQRYSARGEAFQSNLRQNLSSSSAADDAERTQKRSGSIWQSQSLLSSSSRQTLGQLHPQTPAPTQFTQMLNTYANMSSPGGLTNLSFTGYPSLGQFSPVAPQLTANTNSGSSSGGATSQGASMLVHKPPFMATFTVESLDNFVTQTETHLAGQKLCPISTWIPMHSGAWETMYWSFESRGLINGVSEFKALLEDTPQFLTVAKQYLQKSRAVKGVRSDQEAVRTMLKFKFNNPTHDLQKDGLTTQWVKFIHEFRDLIENPSGSDQTELVDAFIEVNLLRVSKAQNFMFSHLRDMKPKPTSLREAYQALLSKWRSTEGNCEVGLQVGMIFPDPTYLQYVAPESNKSGGSATAAPKRARSDTEQQGQSTDQISTTSSNYVGICTMCGIKNKHPPKSCPSKGKPGQHLNYDPNTEYAQSKAWEQVLERWPTMLEATGYPRNPSQYHISQCEGPTKQTTGSSKPPQNPTRRWKRQRKM